MAKESYMKKITGVFGWPVAENPTIVMQQAAFDALELPFVYLNFEVPEGALEQAVNAARTLDFAGFNCTIPHKTNVLQYLDELRDEAKLMGAVNTIYNQNGRLIGANTDGKGFMLALEANGIDPAGKHVVVLGAGGASRAICTELALGKASEITIVNRTPERGQALARLVNENTACRAEYVRWDGAFRLPEDAGILVNATNIGLYPDSGCPDVDFATVSPSLTVCDVIPNPPVTPFLKAAAARGAKTLDGLGMLVYQGAVAFEEWTGKQAPIAVMREALAKEFGL